MGDSTMDARKRWVEEKWLWDQEWVFSPIAGGYVCPACGAPWESNTHFPNCKRQAIIAKAKGEA